MARVTKKIRKNALIELAPQKFQTLGDVEKFFNAYGVYCLYFALTNQKLKANDLSWNCLSYEMLAMERVGFKKWVGFIEAVNTLKRKIYEIYLNKYGVEYKQVKSNKLFDIRLEYFHVYPFLTLPHLNPINDDNLLVNTYIKLTFSDEYNTYYNFDENYNLIKTIYEYENSKLTIKEQNIKTDFPISVQDRLTYLFNSEIAADYEKLINNFK